MCSTRTERTHNACLCLHYANPYEKNKYKNFLHNNRKLQKPKETNSHKMVGCCGIDKKPISIYRKKIPIISIFRYIFFYFFRT